MQRHGLTQNLLLDGLLRLKLYRVLTMEEQFKVLRLMQSQGLIQDDIVIEFTPLSSQQQVNIPAKFTLRKKDEDPSKAIEIKSTYIRGQAFYPKKEDPITPAIAAFSLPWP